MLLTELTWEPDNPIGYAVDRYHSQWLMPTIRHPDYEPPASVPEEVLKDLFEGVMEQAPEYLEYNYYRVVKREPPHVRAGRWSVRCYSAMGEVAFKQQTRHFDMLEVACFISHLTPVERNKPCRSKWWKEKWKKTTNVFACLMSPT